MATQDAMAGRLAPAIPLRVPGHRGVLPSAGREEGSREGAGEGPSGGRPGRPASGRPQPMPPAEGDADAGIDDVGQVVAAREIRVGDRRWLRLLVRTHVIQPGEDIAEVVARYVGPHLAPGDWVFVGQKAVSISQRRLVYERAVRPRPLAVLLSRHVKRTPYGRGLGRPATMEIAIREAGVWRILLAAAVHVLGRPFGRTGDFYRVAGRRVASIDGVTEWALPPFNRYIVLHPEDAEGEAARIARRVGAPVAIVDLNDLGGAVLGASPGLDRALVLQVLRDNPLGQGPFRTPVGIARRLDGPAG